MKAAIEAIVSLVQGTPAVAAFAGTGGPFWEIAPEGTAFPYMTIGQIGGMRNLYGFSGGSYVGPLHMQIDLYDTNLETVSANAETLCATFDFQTLTLTGGQICRNILRLEEPRVITEGIEGSGKRVYHAIVQYRLNVQRTVGA